MANWVLIPCLAQLRSEFNEIAPGRDKASDGAVGDAAHQAEVSDHNPDETGSVPIHDADKINEVHAIDVDDDLRTDDLTMEKVVQFLLARCRSGAETRLRYIIYNRRIWSASSGWVQKTYAGASPHTEHAHFSASYDSSREASVASWHLEDIPVAITPAEINAIAQKVWEWDGIPAPAGSVDGAGKPNPTWSGGDYERNGYSEAKAARIAATAALAAANSALAAIGQVDENVITALADTGRSDREIADVLRGVLGGRAAAVGQQLIVG